MSKFSYFKIESEIEEKIDLGSDGLIDNTYNRIFYIKPEMYADDFNKLQIEFGKPLNSFKDFDDFQIWLGRIKNLDVESIEFDFVDNYTRLTERLPITLETNGENDLK